MSKESTAIKETPKTPSVDLDPRYIGKLTATLLSICCVVALLLGIVNSVTEPIIRRMQEEKTAAAMALVLQADSYDKMDVQFDNVTAMYHAMAGGQQIGYVVEVTSSGFGGAMNIVVGVDMAGKVTGVSVTKHAETKNIGTKVADSAPVLSRFIGLSGNITVNAGPNRFDGISGATVSSKAVTAGVNTALSAVAAQKN